MPGIRRARASRGAAETSGQGTSHFDSGQLSSDRGECRYNLNVLEGGGRRVISGLVLEEKEIKRTPSQVSDRNSSALTVKSQHTSTNHETSSSARKQKETNPA